MRTSRALPILPRLLARITKTSTCWIWNGAKKDERGYGVINWDGRSWLVHRAAYALFVGPIPAGMTIDHLCRNTSCVNPDHLEPVTNRENVLRGIGPTAVNSRKAHCKFGHPFDVANTHVMKNGGRDCRTCRRERATPFATHPKYPRAAVLREIAKATPEVPG